MCPTLSRLLVLVMAITSVLASTLLVSCQKKADTPPVATEPLVDSVASSDGVMIHFEVVGQGEPTLVFVHGWSCDRSYWREQVVEFSKTYRVVMIDYGGHGRSGLGREDWTMEAFGADVVAVVSKLNPEKVILIGHSMGGGVNLEAAKLLPERVLALIGVDTYKKFGTGYPQDEVDEYVAQFREDFVSSTDQFVRNFFPDDADTLLVDWVAADMSSAPPEVGTNAMANFFTSNQVQALKDVNTPIWAINSDKSPTDTVSNREHASSFELKLMSGVGHFNMMEDPATFNRLLHEAIKEVMVNQASEAHEG